MAKETKSIKVYSFEKERTIKDLQLFGWILISMQGTNDENLFFERDTSMQNYNELVSLEKEYNSLYKPGYSPSLGGGWIVFGIVLFILGLLASSGGAGGVSAILIIPGIVIIIVKPLLYFNEKKRWNQNCIDYVFKSSEIFNRAKQLL